MLIYFPNYRANNDVSEKFADIKIPFTATQGAVYMKLIFQPSTDRTFKSRVVNQCGILTMFLTNLLVS